MGCKEQGHEGNSVWLTLSNGVVVSLSSDSSVIILDWIGEPRAADIVFTFWPRSSEWLRLRLLITFSRLRRGGGLGLGLEAKLRPRLNERLLW